MLSNLFNKFAQLPPIKKAVVGVAVAGTLVLGGVTMDKAVDADWGQDSSGWTQAQKDHRHAERWREIGQGAVILFQALEHANDQQQSQPTQQPSTYPDYHQRTSPAPQQQDDGGSYHRQQLPPPSQTVPVEEHKQAPAVVPAPKPAQPTVDWKDKYKHVDDYNRNAAPPVKKDKPAYDNGGVVKPNNNGDWMNKYKSVTPTTKPSAQKAPAASGKR